jgi:hypothetical protein
LGTPRPLPQRAQSKVKPQKHSLCLFPASSKMCGLSSPQTFGQATHSASDSRRHLCPPISSLLIPVRSSTPTETLPRSPFKTPHALSTFS